MLQISNLCFSYHNKEIFNRANLNIAYPQTIAIIGDNGSGKTTLIKLIRGELTPDDGTIRAHGSIGYLQQTHENLIDKSGGERTRLALEQLFAQTYDILLLDEPTNNLDSTAKTWLLQKLQNFSGLILIVSHDRNFIDQVADQVLEVKNGELQLFPGNYTTYHERNLQLRHQQLQNYTKAQHEKRRLERRISEAYNDNNRVSNLHFNKIRDENKMVFHGRRNHAQNTASRVINTSQTKLARLSTIEKPLERKTYQSKISAHFLRNRRLLKISDLSKSYGTKALFQDLNFDIYTGNRLRIIGPNGSGKTTLFKVVLGLTSANSGEVKLALGLKLGYISQDVYGLDLAKSFLSQTATPTTEVFQAATTMDLGKTELQSPINQLSRGQITKLAFLNIILAPVDLLILDEPTNHLDIRARENIEQALQNYPGAILFATHDEVFADKLQAKSLSLSNML